MSAVLLCNFSLSAADIVSGCSRATSHFGPSEDVSVGGTFSVSAAVRPPCKQQISGDDRTLIQRLDAAALIEITGDGFSVLMRLL